MKHHSLRRTREKLKIMMDTPHMSWILQDMIEIAHEQALGEPSWYTVHEKLQLIERLKNRYEKLIREQEQIPLKQGRLDI